VLFNSFFSRRYQKKGHFQLDSLGSDVLKSEILKPLFIYFRKSFGSTIEYERHYDLLKGKNLEELNWALWPTLNSIEKIQAYSTIYNLAHDNRFVDPWHLYIHRS